MDTGTRLHYQAQDTADTYAILDRLIITREYLGEMVEASEAPPVIAGPWRAWHQWILSVGLLEPLTSELPRKERMRMLHLVSVRVVLSALERLIWKESLAVAAAEWHAELHRAVDAVVAEHTGVLSQDGERRTALRTTRNRYRSALQRLEQAERKRIR